MCRAGQAPTPATAAQAVAMAQASLSFLATADAASLTTAEQADVLRAAPWGVWNGLASGHPDQPR